MPLAPMIFLLSSLALAAPDRVAHTLSAQGEVTDIAISPNGAYIAFFGSGSSKVEAMDTRRWTLFADANTCQDEVTAVGFVQDASALDSDEEARVYVGCNDGTMFYLSLADGEFGTYSDKIAVEDEVPILGIIGYNDGIYAVAEDPDGGYPQMYGLDAATGTVDTSTWPARLSNDGFEDIVAVDGYAFVIQGSDNVSQVYLAGGSSTTGTTGQSGAKCVDGAVAASTGAIMLACGGSIYEYQYGTDSFHWAHGGWDFGDTTAIWVDDGVSGHEALLVADDDTGEVLAFDWTGTGDYTADTPEAAIVVEGTINEMVGTDGYTYAGTSEATIAVLTANPWVTVLDIEPATAITGEEVLLTFTSDTAGDYTVTMGAGGSGDELTSGQITADGMITTRITVTDDFVEGINPIRVEVDDGALKGHDVGDLTVDNPPGTVSLAATSLQFGNLQLTLSFSGLDDEDLASYTIYVSDEAFDVTDSAGAPGDFDTSDDLDLPIEVTDVGPGDDVELDITPLQNGKTYYVAVIAWDEGGQEGLMSNVVSGTPQETYSASAMSGQEWSWCGTRAPISALLALLGCGLVSRRRSAAAAVLVAGGLAASTPAQAISFEHTKAVQGGIEMSYGNIALVDEDLTGPFGADDNQVFHLEYGPSWRGLAEIHVGTGLFKESGFTLGEDGDQSGEADNMLMLPVTIGATLRLDLLDEQPLVPYVGAGADYWLWREKWEVNTAIDASGFSQMSGGKPGWHYQYGAQFLLDWLDRDRASVMESKSGIHDSYLTVEMRKQVVDQDAEGYLDGNGLSFSGTSVTFGIRLNL